MLTVIVPANIKLDMVAKCLYNFFVQLEAAKSRRTSTKPERTMADFTGNDKVVHPSKKVHLKGIDDAVVKKHWGAFVQKYSGAWKKYKEEPLREWAACFAIWINYCHKHDIIPFAPNSTALQIDTTNSVLKRINGARAAQLDFVKKFEDRGKAFGVLQKDFLKEVFKGIKPDRSGMYISTTERRMVLTKGMTPRKLAFSNWLNVSSMEKVQQQRAWIKRNIRSGASVLVRVEDEKPILVLENVFTQAHVQSLLGLSDTEMSKPETVQKKLASFWRSFLKN